MKIDMRKIRKAQILLYMICDVLEGRSFVKDVDGYVDTYQNGREAGYTVCLNYPTKVTFAENRNSDAIVVYLNNDANQGLTDKAYETAKYFRYNDYKGACTYCVKHLLKGLK